MKRDPTRDRLPVTAEVGSEGGSYADATLQEETFAGPSGVDRVDPASAGLDGDRLPAASDGEQVLDEAASVRPATEPPGPQK